MNNELTENKRYHIINFSNEYTVHKVNIYIRENSFTQKDKRIGEYTIEGGIKKYLISPVYGKVVKIDLEEKEIIIERCSHEAFYYNLCKECNYDVRY